MSSIPGAMCQLAWLHYRGYIKIHEDVQEGIEGFPIALQILSWILFAMNGGGMKMMKAISLYRYTAIYEAQVNAHWIPIPSWVVRCETREGQVVRKFMCSWQYTMMLFICVCSYRPIGYVVMLQFQGDVLSIWSNRHDAREHDGIIPKRYILWLDLISIQFRIFEESCAQSRSTFIVNWSQQKNKKHSPDPFSLSKWKWCVHCNGNIYRHTRRFDFCFLTEFSCHILSSLLQGNSSLVDTWERCFAKLHRRKKNKHRMDHVGPSNGRLESWKLWIFQVPVEGQATKWTI